MTRHPIIDRALAEWRTHEACFRELHITRRMWFYYASGEVKPPRAIVRLIQSRLELASLERRLADLAGLTSREHVGLPAAPVSGEAQAKVRAMTKKQRRLERLYG